MTSEKLILHVKKRDVLGKKSKQLRDQGLVIGNIVRPGSDSLPVSMDALEVAKMYDVAGESSLVYLSVEGQKTQVPVLIKEADFDPVQGKMFHVVFLKVSLKEKIEAAIPVEFEGEFDVSGASLIKVKDTVDVSALPTDLPESFTVNLEDLKEIGDQITLADLSYDSEKIELVLPEETEKEDVVLALAQAEAEEEPEEEVSEESEDESTAETAETVSSEGGEEEKSE